MIKQKAQQTIDTSKLRVKANSKFNYYKKKLKKTSNSVATLKNQLVETKNHFSDVKHKLVYRKLKDQIKTFQAELFQKLRENNEINQSNSIKNYLVSEKSVSDDEKDNILELEQTENFNSFLKDLEKGNKKNQKIEESLLTQPATSKKHHSSRRSAQRATDKLKTLVQNTAQREFLQGLESFGIAQNLFATETNQEDFANRTGLLDSIHMNDNKQEGSDFDMGDDKSQSVDAEKASFKNKEGIQEEIPVSGAPRFKTKTRSQKVSTSKDFSLDHNTKATIEIVDEAGDHRLRSGKTFIKSSKSKNPLRETSNKKKDSMSFSDKNSRLKKSNHKKNKKPVQVFSNLEMKQYDDSPEKRQVETAIGIFGMAVHKDYAESQFQNLVESTIEVPIPVQNLNSRLRRNYKSDSKQPEEELDNNVVKSLVSDAFAKGVYMDYSEYQHQNLVETSH